MGLRHRMLKLPLVLALLVVGQNHAKLSNASKKKLMQYRTMLEAAEKAGLEGNATTTTPGSTTTTSGGMNPAAEGMNGSNTTSEGNATTTTPASTTTTSGGMNPAVEGMNGSTTTPGLTTTTSGPADKVDDNATTAANGTAGALRYGKVDIPSDAGNDNSDTIPRCMIPEGCPTNTKGPAGEGTALRYLDNNAGDSTKTDQKQLAQLIKSIFGQLSSGNPVKMVVDIKNPEVMIGNDEQEAQLGPRNRV